MLTELAPAKVNLFLHVLGRREDGYHLLESLVGFAGAGDDLALEPGRPLALVIDGPLASGLAGADDNLVLAAARLFAAAVPGAVLGQFHLTKRLPVASGIGGGSSDAAAALRLLARANGLDAGDLRLGPIAAALGADVPVCIEARPRLMRGIGHDLGPALAFDAVPALLVNPGVAVETRAVFSALGLAPGTRFIPPPRHSANAPDADAIIRLICATRNDLEPPARMLAPAIVQVLDALKSAAGSRLARMSGSGATCFALFNGTPEAERAAAALLDAHPEWWICQTAIQVPH